MTSILINSDALRSANPIKIDDLAEKKLEQKFSKEECIIRRKLAAAYRLTDLLGWSEGIYNHITCRVPDDNNDQFLINPFGMLFHEVTASSLIKVDVDGKVIDRGTSGFGVNNRGYVIHSAVHAARPEVKCVFHIHGAQAIAASCLKEAAFMPVSQEGCILGPVSTHQFHGTAVNLDERKIIVENLGENNILVLRNHGFLTCGHTVEAAIMRAFWFMQNANVQSYLTGVPPERIVMPTDEAKAVCYNAMKEGEKSGEGDDPLSYEADQQWGMGELDWEAWMRCLDRMGLQTGHNYRNTTWKNW